jgi:PEP-CTERM motif
MPAFAMAPYNFPANSYGLSTDQQKKYSVLDFHVDTGSSMTLTQFVATLLASTDSAHIIFAADVFSGNTSSTGVIGFTRTSGEGPPPVPLPGALPLFASGLGALGLLGWRRKREKAAAIAAA